MEELSPTELEPIQAYCVRCRQSVDMDNPVAVWTRRGLPATRGECPDCGGVVFRMGKTALHDGDDRPDAISVGTTRRVKLAQETVYVAYAVSDEAMAEQIAADLQRIGVATWLHEHAADDVNWAAGVHPALTECVRMVVLLSPDAVSDPSVETAWRFFRQKNKPILLAQVADDTPPPDAIRRSARFNFVSDYKSAFRQMVQALS